MMDFTFVNIPVDYTADRSKVPVLLLLCVASWFILRGDLYYVLPCVFSSALLALQLPLKEESWSVCFSCVYLFCSCWFVSLPSSSQCQGLAAVCDSGTPWTFRFSLLAQFVGKCDVQDQFK